MVWRVSRREVNLVLREEKKQLRILSEWVTEKMILFSSQIANTGGGANCCCGT